ncbi:formin [Gambusia affinis]|uniref:formin n=1 Tax=Gambusia affinis TaxID=33528 RepID=UPI001CDD5047|nr:formin [Gambusia affinis]
MEKPRTLTSPMEAENADLLTNNSKMKSEDAYNPFNDSECYFTKSLQSDASFTEKETRKQYILEEQKTWVESIEIASDTENWMPNNDEINSAVEDKVNDCKEVDLSLDKFGITEAISPKCPQNDEQDDIKRTENNGAHFQEDGFSLVHSAVETKHPVIIVKRLIYAVEEQEPELEDAEGKEKRKYSEYEEEDASARFLSSPNDFPLHINKQTVNPPIGSTLTRATFSPGCPTDKKVAFPVLFSGLRGLRKGIGGPENGTSTQTKQSPPFAKSPVFTEKQSDTKTQNGFLDQISHILNQEKAPGDKKDEDLVTETHQDEIGNQLDGNDEPPDSKRREPQAEEDTKPVEPTRSLSSAEAAFDAFKAFFTPKPLKKDSTERIDLEAVRKKMRNDKDVLRTIFERTSKKTLEKNDACDGKSETPTAEGEEKTPGRLQAVWPPLKEEKVGLKYTEAEHQAAVLQLKRECKQEQEKLQEDYERQLCKLRDENRDNVARLELMLEQLQAKVSQVWSQHPDGLKDVAVSTTDGLKDNSFRNVSIQTDRENLITSPEDGDITTTTCSDLQQSLEASKNPDMVSTGEVLSSSSVVSTLPQSHPPSSQKQHSLSPPPPPPPPPPPGVAPPPPPPPPPGVAHPPPPPSAGGVIAEKPPRKQAVEPSRAMKPLYWTRIQIQDDNNHSLWNMLEEPHINANEFEDLFAKTTTMEKRKPLLQAYEKKAKAKKIIKLLDSKRSQAVGILISSLHLEMKDIQQAVLTVDHSVVDLDAIEALYENRAQPDELEKIRKHCESSEEDDVKLLDKPEQFLYELSQIPDFPGRACCIIFQSTFTDGISSVKRKLSSVSCVCKVLLESSGVREVMGLVLALGNHMNGGSRIRGQADGFGLEILPKLKDVKSRDNRISLLDYIVSYYLHNMDKNAGTEKSMFPLPEPQDVFTAAQVKFDDLNRDLRQLEQDLTRVEKNVHKVCSESSEEHLQPFKDKMEAFVLTARKEHAEASYQLMTVQKTFQDVALHFGLKPKPGEKEVTTGHLFMLWFEFSADFKARWKRENKTISKERLKEAQLTVKRITGEKKVETRKINPNSLKERLRQKEAQVTSP